MSVKKTDQQPLSELEERGPIERRPSEWKGRIVEQLPTGHQTGFDKIAQLGSAITRGIQSLKTHVLHHTVLVSLNALSRSTGNKPPSIIETAKKMMGIKALQWLISQKGAIASLQVTDVIEAAVERANRRGPKEKEKEIRFLSHLAMSLGDKVRAGAEGEEALRRAKHAMAEAQSLWSASHNEKKDTLPPDLADAMAKVAVQEAALDVGAQDHPSLDDLKGAISEKSKVLIASYPSSQQAIQEAVQKEPLPEQIYQKLGATLLQSMPYEIQSKPGFEEQLAYVRQRSTALSQEMPCHVDAEQLMKAAIARGSPQLREAFSLQQIIDRSRKAKESKDPRAQTRETIALSGRAQTLVREAASGRYGDSALEREPFTSLARHALETAFETAPSFNTPFLTHDLASTWVQLYSSGTIKGKLSLSDDIRGQAQQCPLSDEAYRSLGRSARDTLINALKDVVPKEYEGVINQVLDTIIADCPFKVEKEQLRRAIFHNAIEEDYAAATKALTQIPLSHQWCEALHTAERAEFLARVEQKLQPQDDSSRAEQQPHAHEFAKSVRDHTEKLMEGGRFDVEVHRPSMTFLERHATSKNPEIHRWAASTSASLAIANTYGRMESVTVGTKVVTKTSQGESGEDMVQSSYGYAQAIFQECKSNMPGVADDKIWKIVNELMMRTTIDVMMPNIFGLLSKESDSVVQPMAGFQTYRFSVNEQGKAVVEVRHLVSKTSSETGEVTYMHLVSKIVVDPHNPGHWTEEVTTKPISSLGSYLAEEVKQQEASTGASHQEVLDSTVKGLPLRVPSAGTRAQAIKDMYIELGLPPP
jgi:hypothetical protein